MSARADRRPAGDGELPRGGCDQRPHPGRKRVQGARSERPWRFGKMPPNAAYRTRLCLVVTPTGIEPVSPP